MDTIFALATATGRAGVAIVRVSGPRSVESATAVCGPLGAPRMMVLRSLRTNDEDIDRGLVVWFPAGASFTGEEVVEFQLHGSRAVVAALLATLGRMPGMRAAEPGEFTRRALGNDRLDLTQVEGLSDLIDAETETQRRQALRVLSGEFGQRIAHWRDVLTDAQSLMTAMLDFVDEDVPDDVSAVVLARLGELIAELRREVQGASAAERIRDGFEVAIIGPPNVGKSTLLNRLAGRDAAITAATEGTTRDIIEVRMDIGGLAVTILDTAGLRSTDDPVEAEGIARTRQRSAEADMRVFLTETGTVGPTVVRRDGDIVRGAKGDILPSYEPAISGITGAGVDDLVDQIGKELARRASEAGLAIRARHVSAMTRAAGDLEDAIALLYAARGIEVVSEKVRQASDVLATLTGKIGVEDVLERVFRSFCIGK